MRNCPYSPGDNSNMKKLLFALALLAIPPAALGLISNRLEAGLSVSPVQVSQPLELWCTTANSAVISTCSWDSPDGNVYEISGNVITDGNGDVPSGISVVDPSNLLSCRIRVESLSAAQTGSWSCRVSTGTGPFQVAVLNAILESRVSEVMLPKGVSPVEYTVKLIPHIVVDDFVIEGEMEVILNITESVDKIYLHAKELVIYEDTVSVAAPEEITVAGFGYDRDRDFFVIYLESTVPAGTSELVVSMQFLGDLNDDLSGFYRSSYVSNGVTHFLATTQFQATDARKAFPCMDEPAQKAVFNIHLGRTAEFVTASNMPIREMDVPIPDKEEYVYDIFEPTKRMSTYLLAFLISDFTYREAEVQTPVPFRIWSKPELFANTEYASQIGPIILQYYDDYFNIPFPLPKQDMAAIPDLSFGGMENWGLVMYRESVLLYQPGVSSLQARDRVADVVSHELAHQWFGDLVTMGWWSDLWLNEGFATYMALLGGDQVEPTFRQSERAILSINQAAYSLDALESSHPVQVTVNHPDEINEIFDAISYEKGAALIRMMVNFLGEPTFRKGIENYLNTFAYGNAFTDDLLLKLTEAAEEDGALAPGLTVKTIMDSWTMKKGFPYVTVTRVAGRNVTVEQSRFLFGEPDPADQTDYRWWVPLSYAVVGGNFSDTKNQEWLSPEVSGKMDLYLPADMAVEPFVFNVQGTGFYRVNYDTANWLGIADALAADPDAAVHSVSRAQLLDDALTLARHGTLAYTVAMEVTEYLDREEEYVPWGSASNSFSYLTLMMQRAADFDDMKNYIIEKVSHLYDRLGYESSPTEDTYFDVILREMTLSYMCGFEQADCVDKATAEFDIWFTSADPDSEGSNPIDVGIRGTVYCTAVAAGDADTWDFLWQRYLRGSNANEKSVVLSALGCSKDVQTLERYLDMTLNSGSGLGKTDGLTVVSAVSSNSLGTPVAWDWLQTEWSAILAYYDTAVSSPVARMVTAVTRSFNTQTELDELRQFQSDNRGNLGTAERATETAVKTTEANLAWMESSYSEVVEWLQARGKEGENGGSSWLMSNSLHLILTIMLVLLSI